MNMKIIQPKNQNGLSLVEILVSMVISIFLLGGVIQVYTGNKTTYNFSEAMSRIQENGRFAMDAITRDLRMAGFWGCATYNFADTRNLVNNLDPGGLGYDTALYDFVNNPPVTGTENDGTNGSDSITIRGAAPGQTTVLPPYNSPTSDQIFGANVAGLLEADDIVLLSNCKGADIFQITSITQGTGSDPLSIVHNTGSGSPGNYNPEDCQSGHCLSQTYGGDSAILKLQTVRYTITPNEDGTPALFRALFENNFELVDGVEQLQVLYGINTDDSDTNTTPNQYISSTDVTDWRQVTAVRVMLLMVSPNNVSMPDAQRYRYNNEDIVSTDVRLRQVFSTTIALRNRI